MHTTSLNPTRGCRMLFFKTQDGGRQLNELNVNNVTCVNFNIILFRQPANIKQQ